MVSSRRNFLAVVGMVLMGRTSQANAFSFKSKKNVIVHHVLFWLKDASSEEDKNKLVAGLTSLKKIEDHHTFIGLPIEALKRDGTDSSYNVSLLTYFDDASGRASYESNPVYQKFIMDCSHLWQKVVMYDSLSL